MINRSPFRWIAVAAWATLVGCGSDAVTGEGDAAPATVDARPAQTPDASPPDASPPDARVVPDASPPDASPPDVRVIPDAAIPPPDSAAPPSDAVPAPDACVSDPRCNGAAGDHCDGDGAVVTCVQAGPNCFHVSGEATACPDHQTCADGASACACATDPRCASGAGSYCDPAGSDAFYTCAADANGCVIAAADQACADPRVCTGAANAGNCVCPAIGTTEGTGCNNPDQLTCDPAFGNVLLCKTVDGCNVWTKQFDCASLSLTCNNNQCTCPSNTSHNYYVGPNYPRVGVPAGVSPNGLLTANGMCTFPTLGEGLFAAASDVLLTNPTITRVIAVTFPGTTARFANERLPIVVGNRTILTTYADPDPNVGGPGHDPGSYFIDLVGQLQPTAQLVNSLGTGIFVDPSLSSGGQAALPPEGGSAGFKGFTVQTTEHNILCGILDGFADYDEVCASGPGLGAMVMGSSGRLDMAALNINGLPLDPSGEDLPEDFIFPRVAIGVGLILLDRDEDHPGDGPWGTFDRIHINDTNGPALLSVSQQTGTFETPHRSIFSHYVATDTVFGLLQAGGSSITFLKDPAEPFANRMVGTAPTEDTIGTMVMGMLIVPGGNDTTQIPDLEAQDVLIKGADVFGALVVIPGQDVDPDAPEEHARYAARFIGGEISASTTGGLSLTTFPAVSAPGIGLFAPIAGALVDPSNDDTSRFGFFEDPSGDDIPVGGLLLDGTVIKDNSGAGLAFGNPIIGANVNTKQATHADQLFESAAFLDGAAWRKLPWMAHVPKLSALREQTRQAAAKRAVSVGPQIIVSALVTLNNVVVEHNGIIRDDVGFPDDMIDAPVYSHDGIIIESTDLGGPLLVDMIGGRVSNNGIQGDLTRSPTGTKPANSYGNGVYVVGGTFTATGTEISDNTLGGVYATDSPDTDALLGRVTLDNALITRNSKDRCASVEEASCYFPAVFVANHGGFYTRAKTRIIENNWVGVITSSSARLPILNDDFDLICNHPLQPDDSLPDCPPLQAFSDTIISDNGRDTPRDNTGPFAMAYGLISTDDPSGLGGTVTIDQGTLISGNLGAGVFAVESSVTYFGDALVENNGFNAGVFDLDDEDLETILPQPHSGVEVDAQATVIVRGVSGDGAVLRANAVHGMHLVGTLRAEKLRATGNTKDGLFVDALVGDGASPSLVRNSQFDDNGGDGLNIRRTHVPSVSKLPARRPAADDAVVPDCIPEFTLGGDRPTLRSLTTVHDNHGNGVTIGSLDEELQTGVICALIGDADIMNNGAVGIETAQSADIGTRQTEAYLLDNDVFSNVRNGLFVHPSYVGQFAGDPPSFSQNKFHNNGLNQVIFSGGGDGVTYSIDSPTGACDAGANAVYCYTAKMVFGVFAQDIAHVFIQHTQFEGGGTGLKDFSAQSGSTISVSANCTAITVCP